MVFRVILSLFFLPQIVFAGYVQVAEIFTLLYYTSQNADGQNESNIQNDKKATLQLFSDKIQIYLSTVILHTYPLTFARFKPHFQIVYIYATITTSTVY